MLLNTHLIFTNITRHIQLTDAEKAHFSSLLVERQLAKNESVLKQEELCKYLYFVNEGTLRAFFLNTKGKESTVMFATQDWWITDMHCFLNELPAMVHIEAVENSRVLQLAKHDLDQLYEDIPAFNQFFRVLMQNAYCREQLRMIQNLSLPALERYENFMDKYPQLANKVTLKQIASYLGITPEFLSTIRATRK